MKTIIGILISYISLYLVIYLHEVGHAIFYYKYGCKDNWWQVTVKPYLFFSTPLPVDIEKARLLSKKQNIFVASGGIIVNLISAVISFLILKMADQNYYINLFLYQFITLHLGEAVTYLVIGNIYLVSDMETIAAQKPSLRPFYFIFGLLVGIIYILVLKNVPNQYKFLVYLFNIVSILCMSIGRIVFTIIHKRNSKEKRELI